MKVKEMLDLIKTLAQIDPNAEIVIRDTKQEKYVSAIIAPGIYRARRETPISPYSGYTISKNGSEAIVVIRKP